MNINLKKAGVEKMDIHIAEGTYAAQGLTGR